MIKLTSGIIINHYTFSLINILTAKSNILPDAPRKAHFSQEHSFPLHKNYLNSSL